jgi:Icc-related predicted phosphoesterase
MKILAVSDIELGFIYNTHIAERFGDVDLVISCGDLPYYYLEFIVSMLDKPLYFVRGNHASKTEFTTAGERSSPWGAANLHRRVVRDDSGLLLAGIEGSLQYNLGPYQYSQEAMWRMVLMMTPALFLNKLRHGRYLDIFVSHAPPWKIGDMDDLPHRGIKAFRWLIKTFRPAYHLHGHIHIYHSDRVEPVRVEKTWVLNTYGYREIEYQLPAEPQPVTSRSRQLAERSKPDVG